MTLLSVHVLLLRDNQERRELGVQHHEVFEIVLFGQHTGDDRDNGGAGDQSGQHGRGLHDRRDHPD